MTELFLLKNVVKKILCNRNYMEQGCRVYFSFQPIRGETRSIHTRDLTSFFSVLTFTKNNAMNNKKNNNICL